MDSDKAPQLEARTYPYHYYRPLPADSNAACWAQMYPRQQRDILSGGWARAYWQVGNTKWSATVRLAQGG